MAAVTELIDSYGIGYHQFADDTQLLVTMSAANTTSALAVLSQCSAAVRLWFLRNGLMLNADKSEVIILGTAPQLKSLTTVRTVDVAGSSLPVAPKLKSLGVIIDPHLRFDKH